MGLWKRGDVWYYDFTVRGQRSQGSTGTANKREADLVLTKLKLEAYAKADEPKAANPNATVAEIAALFLTNGAARPHHKERLKFLLSFFGLIQVRNLTRGMAEDYRRDRKAAKTVSDATVNRDLSTLRRVFYWALDHGYLATNPFARLRMVPEPKKFRKVLSITEEQKLLAAAPKHLAEMAMTSLDTGMRRGEVTQQRWEDIDLTRRIIFVSKSKTIGGQLRELPMTERIYTLLAAKKQAEGFVFTYNDEPVRILKTAWKATLRRAGLTSFARPRTSMR